MTAYGLGKDFDIVPGVVPVADTEAALTGLRCHMKNYGGIAVVGFFGAVSAGTDTFVMDIQQSDAATGGNTKDLDSVTQWFIKSETTLDADEQWTRVTQSAASEISMTGATYSATQVLVVAQIDADDLDVAGGYEWVSVVQADPGSGGTRAGCYFYVPYGLKVQRRPDLLVQPNA